MSVTVLHISADEARAEAIAEHLSNWDIAGPPAASAYDSGEGSWAVAAYFEDAPDIDLIIDYLQDRLDDQAKQSLLLSPLEDKDWVSETQAGLHPVTAGSFIVHGSHDRKQFQGRSRAIEIDAGQAFGTAHHGTTRGCLFALDNLLTQRHFRTILDVGTGSGILAIAAAKKSKRSHILATDNDPIAIQVAKTNCRLNGVAQQISLTVAEGLAHSSIVRLAPYDLVIANILAPPLTFLAPAISRTTTLGSYIILSGLLDEQAPKITARYRSFGFTVQRRISLEGWSTMVLQKRQ